MEGRADGADRGAAAAHGERRSAGSGSAGAGGDGDLIAPLLALAACGPGTPEAWIGVDQAVVIGGGIVADVTASRIQPDGTWLRKTDRCHLFPDGRTEGCVLPPAGKSLLSKVGDLLVDDRTDPDGNRSIVVLDPDTLADRAVLPVGLPTEARVVGGALLPGPDGGLMVAANHGLAGVETVEGPAAWTLEAWVPGEAAPRWRRAMRRSPDQVLLVGELVVVHAGERWRALDRQTGEPRWERDGAMGGCVGGGALWVAEEGKVRAFPLDGGEPTETPFEPPGHVLGCVWWNGSPLFHGGGVGRGDGWLGAPGREWLRVPHVDPELADHVDGDAVWLHEIGRGLSIVRPDAREVGPSLSVHDVVRLGKAVARYRISADQSLHMTLETAAGRAEGDRLVSPRAWHVEGDTLLTFTSIASGPQDLVKRWKLPDLAPLE